MNGSSADAPVETGPAVDPASVVDSLSDRPVILCVGSGGVGKTTTSAALGLAFASRGDRVVVLTVDPARRLADALGLDPAAGNDQREVEVDGLAKMGGSLTATMLDPAATLQEIVNRDALSADQATRILTNPLFTNLSERLSGTNEYMAAERLHQLHHDDRFDRVIVDTPPANHAFDFLDSPARLTRFLEHPLYRTVLGSRSNGGRFGARSLWAQAMFRLLGRLVGGRLVDDVARFFADFGGIDEGFRRRAAEIDALLAGSTTATVLVTTPRSDRIAEARWMARELADRTRTLDALIVNRVLPVLGENEPTLRPEAAEPTGSKRTIDPLMQNLEQLHHLAALEQHAISELVRDLTGEAGQDQPIATVQLTERRTPVADIDGLRQMAAALC